MTAYERVMKALRHERADRLPIDYAATPEFHAGLKRHLAIEDDEDLRRRLGCDLRLVSGRFVGPSHIVPGAGVGAPGRDFLGVVWKPVRNAFATYNEIAFHPLAHVTTVKEVLEHPWPSVDWFDYTSLADEIDRINRNQRYCIEFFVGGAFETPWYMRGLPRFLMDLVECPDIAEAISSRAAEFYKERALRAIEQAKGKIDLVYSGGDIGTQRGMMLSPDLWRRHIKPYSTELIRTFKDAGIATMYHSCGSIVPVIEDLVEMGLDILDPVQPRAKGMDPVGLKARFGDRLVFHGGIDEQHLLPHGSAEDVEREVVRLTEALGSDGGYIVCPAHAIQPDTAFANVIALYDTALAA